MIKQLRAVFTPPSPSAISPSSIVRALGIGRQKRELRPCSGARPDRSVPPWTARSAADVLSVLLYIDVSICRFREDTQPWWRRIVAESLCHRFARHTSLPMRPELHSRPDMRSTLSLPQCVGTPLRRARLAACVTARVDIPRLSLGTFASTATQTIRQHGQLVAATVSFLFLNALPCETGRTGDLLKDLLPQPLFRKNMAMQGLRHLCTQKFAFGVWVCARVLGNKTSFPARALRGRPLHKLPPISLPPCKPLPVPLRPCQPFEHRRNDQPVWRLANLDRDNRAHRAWDSVGSGRAQASQQRSRSGQGCVPPCVADCSLCGEGSGVSFAGVPPGRRRYKRKLLPIHLPLTCPLLSRLHQMCAAPVLCIPRTLERFPVLLHA